MAEPGVESTLGELGGPGWELKDLGLFTLSAAVRIYAMRTFRTLALSAPQPREPRRRVRGLLEE